MSVIPESTTESQRKGIVNTILMSLAIIAMVLVLFLNKMLSPRVMTIDELHANGAILFDQSRTLPAFTLTTHNNDIFTSESLKGKWNVLFFGFSHCPEICPTTLATLAQVYQQLDKKTRAQTRIIMVSVDPARDTPEALATYVKKFHSDFLGVTGNFTDILRLSRNINVAFNKITTEDDYTMDHSMHIVLVDPRGHYVGFIKPPFEVARLKTVYRSVVKLF